MKEEEEERVLEGREKQVFAIFFHADILLGLFDPVHGCDIFLRNVG